MVHACVLVRERERERERGGGGVDLIIDKVPYGVCTQIHRHVVLKPQVEDTDRT